MSVTPEPQFLLLWKGRQSGPFPLAQIREKLSSGEISRMHQINFMGKWIVIDEFMEKHAGPDRETRLRAEAEERENQLRHQFEGELSAERANRNALEQRVAEAEQRARADRGVGTRFQPLSPSQPEHITTTQEMKFVQQMTDQQKMMFMAEMNNLRKDSTTGVLLAFFLGGLGAHHFYMGNTGLGILYAIFCWTFIPAIIAFIECFMMSSRVKAYNDAKAFETAQKIKMMFPA